MEELAWEPRNGALLRGELFFQEAVASHGGSQASTPPVPIGEAAAAGSSGRDEGAADAGSKNYRKCRSCSSRVPARWASSRAGWRRPRGGAITCGGGAGAGLVVVGGASDRARGRDRVSLGAEWGAETVVC